MSCASVSLTPASLGAPAPQAFNTHTHIHTYTHTHRERERERERERDPDRWMEIDIEREETWSVTLSATESNVECNRVPDMHLALRTGLAVYVLAVASVDGRIRFFDLEKLSQLGELDLLNAICTCMTSFNIKDLAGGGGGR
jgi:hypothetical protein